MGKSKLGYISTFLLIFSFLLVNGQTEEQVLTRTPMEIDSCCNPIPSKNFNSVLGSTTVNLDENDFILSISGLNATVNIPAANVCTGKMYSIFHVSSGKSFTFNRAIHEHKGDIQTTFWSIITIISNGTDWYIL